MPPGNGSRSPSGRKPALVDSAPEAWSEPQTEVQLLPLEGYEASFSPIAIIGGGRIYHLAKDRLGIVEDILVKETPFGASTPIYFIRHGERPFYFVPRHGDGRYSVTAPYVNYRAIIWALKDLGVRHIVAWSGPGALKQTLKIGDFALPDDLLDLTRHRAASFFENKGFGILRQHPMFCPQLMKVIGAGLQELGLEARQGGTYAVTEGPRLETRAEVRMLRAAGADMVGMTLAPEAFLARELELCYHPVCYVTNYAEGVRRKAASPEERERERAQLEKRVEALAEIIPYLIDKLADAPYFCPCPDSMLRYKKRGVIGDDFREWIR
ncbi:MAG: MTAP family purine nucleoside phosphorylase [Gemmatimonadetes bacterium]|nr:MTAP family purine nucleoside phosphorylase [Gemmatimonadota bacterium]